MCGFLVQFSKENKNFQKFELANDLLEHRGPDSTKYIESKENFNHVTNIQIYEELLKNY